MHVAPPQHHENPLTRLRRRVGWAIRDRWPTRRVVRVVQGVRMTLPWSHRLPDYTGGDSPYGQNLVQLAQRLTGTEPLVVIDVGANIGDSALQILDVTDARIVCVEADPLYLDFLRTNVGDDPRCRIEPALLIVTESEEPSRVAPVRVGGTTRFVESDSPHVVPSVSPAELRTRHPWTERLRLVKSDTDGYDVSLIPALAIQWSDLKPVLFFEYDVHLSRLAGFDALEVWPALQKLGYAQVAVWGNGGHALGRLGIDQLPAASSMLNAVPDSRYDVSYWDVAVVHADDADGLAAITALVPNLLTYDQTN